jgi:hypothetical protein
MPVVPSDSLYRGTPELLLDSTFRYSLGWRDYRKAGPSFVVARQSGWGPTRVTERFPLTEQGWATAWRELCSHDDDAATATAAKLAAQEARRRTEAELSALDDGSLCYLRRVPFKGGSSGVPLTQGHSYDVRFLSDRIVVSLPGVVAPIVAVPYRDVESVDVSGPEGRSTSLSLPIVLGCGLVGAVLGLLVLGLLGLLLGALIFVAIGAAIAAAAAQPETLVRIRGGEDEFYFVHSDKSPDTLRVELSEPLMVIAKARAGQPGDSGEHEEPLVTSIPDQLTKLASLLEHGNITRDEFDHLKAKLIAQS